MSDYDLIVIGAGPGGYVAAIRAAQLGLKTACVEKRKTLGGTCLNVGCIPSKALLQTSHQYHDASHAFKEKGIEATGLKMNIKKMLGYKNDVVKNLTQGIEYLFKKNKVDWLKGSATIKKSGEVLVDGKAYKTKNILIATGSDVISLPGIDIDEKQIVSSTGALDIAAVPKKMIIIGGGVIGLELGSVWARLGAKVEVIEFLDRITPGIDGQISKEFQKVLTKQGFVFHLGQKVTAAKKSKAGVSLTVEPAKGGDVTTMKADIVLMAVGRKPYTEGLGLEDAGVKTNDRGFIEIDDHFKTSVDGIYAIGDVVPGPMLAHKAEEEGVICVEMLAGQAGHMDYNLVPGIIYTHPEVATIGQTEEQLKEAGVTYTSGQFPFMANSRARANNDTEGFVKILADAKTDKILGCHIIGPDAGNLIHEVAAVMEFGGSAEDIARTCHGHPTLNEAVKEAALAVDKRPIHI